MIGEFLRRLFGPDRSEPTEPLNVAEVRPLYDAVAERFEQYRPSPAPIVEKLLSRLLNVPAELVPLFRKCMEELATDHDFFSLPRLPPDLTMREALELKVRLRTQLSYFDNCEETTKYLMEAVGRLTLNLGELVPKIAAPSPFTIPLSLALPSLPHLIQAIYDVSAEDRYVSLHIYDRLRRQFLANLYRVSGIDPADPHKSQKQIVRPSDGKVPAGELSWTYFRKTPFEELFAAPIPLKFTYEERFSHMHVVGGTNAGKTTLLENLILHDLKSDNPPSLVIVDSQTDLIRKLSRLDTFLDFDSKLREKLVLISPKEIDHPPALNIFDMNRSRMGTYDKATREQVTAGAIQTFDYVFTGLLGADLTAKQGVFFEHVARLMLALPETMGRNATILDMMALMEDEEPYRVAINSLPRLQREFFEKDFPARKGKDTFKQTKEQIRYRLQAIIANPAMERLFTAPETKIDFFEEMNKGSIILVDTAKSFLKEGPSANYGRIIISLVLQAVLERAALPESARRPVFIIIDEASAYFDDNIDDFLTEARKYKCGIVLAHQYLEQAKPGLRASLSANTAIKFAAGVSAADARTLAKDMRTTPEFIMDQPRLTFAAHIRNVTPQAVSIPVYPGQLEKEEQLSDNAYQYLLAWNRHRVSLSDTDQIVRELFIARGQEIPDHLKPKAVESRAAEKPAHRTAPTAPPSPELDEDISKEW